MKPAILRITMTADWLISSSRGGSEADLRPLLDQDELPMIPGRSLRGLLRQATTDAVALLGQDAAELMFGSEGIAGRIGIGDARLPESVAAGIGAGDFEARDLLTMRRRTAIDPETGSALPSSLHSMELAIAGLVLLAPVECDEPTDLPRLALAAALVRRLGMARSRGLGSCTVEVLEGGTVISHTEATVIGGAA